MVKKAEKRKMIHFQLETSERATWRTWLWISNLKDNQKFSK